MCVCVCIICVLELVGVGGGWVGSEEALRQDHQLDSVFKDSRGVYMMIVCTGMCVWSHAHTHTHTPLVTCWLACCHTNSTLSGVVLPTADL